MPNTWLLIPGYGAQGASAADVMKAVRPDGLGAIINSSRGITFPFKPDARDWEQQIERAAREAVAVLRRA
jgi:orotidine-5'-phosphate decarboxylase